MDTSSTALLVAFIIICGATCLGLLALIVTALLQVVHAAMQDSLVKIFWVGVIVIAPVLGALGWFLLGDRTVALRRPLI